MAGEIRRDLLSGKWVIFATGEGFTSRDFLLRRAGRAKGEPCPFCEGQEGETGPEIYALREPGSEPDTTGWSVRVIPDRSPILEPHIADAIDVTATHTVRPPHGHHEVIVLTPEHFRALADLSHEEMVRVVTVLRDRYRELVNLDGVEHVVLMINHGREAGASLRHAHAQLFALPFIPEGLREELELSADHLKETGSCVMCREIACELRDKSRVVAREGDSIAFMPFAARIPFNMYITSISHNARFENLENSALDDLATVIAEGLGRLSEALDDPPYNLVLHASPPREAADLSYHWHMEIMPRLTIAANFELASDVWVNSVTPEVAASILRAAGDTDAGPSESA